MFVLIIMHLAILLVLHFVLYLPRPVVSAQRFFGCWLTFEGSIVDMHYTIGIFLNIKEHIGMIYVVAFMAEDLIETLVNETLGILLLLC